MKSHVNIMDSDIAYENVIVYHGSDHILKEPIYQGGKTDNDYGNGFYTTEYKDRAKSWAVLNGDPEHSFVNRYILNTSGLKIMDLNDYGILAWIAEVIANRGTSLESAEITGSRIVEMYRISTADFDIIKGYRADDSYTQVIEAFLLNQINIEEIKKLFYKGSLGNQIFLKSQKAFCTSSFFFLILVLHIFFQLQVFDSYVPPFLFLFSCFIYCYIINHVVLFFIEY